MPFLCFLFLRQHQEIPHWGFSSAFEWPSFFSKRIYNGGKFKSTFKRLFAEFDAYFGLNSENYFRTSPTPIES
jgi:hypothetical protein